MTAGPFANRAFPSGVIGYYGKGIVAAFGFEAWYRTETDRLLDEDAERALLGITEAMTIRGHLSCSLSGKTIALRGIGNAADGLSMELHFQNTGDDALTFSVAVEGSGFKELASLNPDGFCVIAVPRSMCSSSNTTIAATSSAETNKWRITLLDTAQANENVAASLRELAMRTGGAHDLQPSVTAFGEHLRACKPGVLLNPPLAITVGALAGLF